jgi:type IV secretory pathway TraG/TraD family ATPase VirD4
LDGTFQLHSEKGKPHWWSGARVDVVEVSAAQLVAFPYTQVFTSKGAHWGLAVVLSFLAWPLGFLARRRWAVVVRGVRSRRLLKGRFSFLAKPLRALLAWRCWSAMWQRCGVLREKIKSTSPVRRVLQFLEKRVKALKGWAGISSLAGLLPPRPGIIAGCITLQLMLLVMLVRVQVNVAFEMVPAPHRELALKWPVARLEQALSSNGKFRLHSEGPVHWWNGKRAQVVEVNARELVTLPYGRVFTSPNAHWVRAVGFSFLAWLLFPISLWQLAKETRKIKDDEHIRGAQLRTEDEVAADTVGGILTIGRIHISEALSRRHILIAGQTGSGKSTLMIQHLASIQAAGRRALVNDFKGELVERYYRPGRDLILNPLDPRGLGWTLFNEVESSLDLAAIAGSLIPLAKGDDRFWSAAAQDVLRGVMANCFIYGLRTNEALWQALTAPVKEIARMCRATKFGRAGYSYIQDASSKQAASVIAVLISHVSWLEFATDGGFSLREWSRNPADITIFITSLDEVSNIMKPYLSLFADLAGKRLLALPENNDPKNSIYLLLDELGNMQRLPSVKRLLTAGRSKGLVVEIGVQELAGVESVYGREDTRTIINNCGSKMILNLGDPEAAELFSALGGEEEYLQSSTTYSISQDDHRGGENHTRQQRTRKVIMPAEIMRLPVGTGYFMLPGGNAALVEVPWMAVNERPASNEAFVLRPGLSLEDLKARDLEIALAAQEARLGPVPEELKKQYAENALERSRGKAEADEMLGISSDQENEKEE